MAFPRPDTSLPPAWEYLIAHHLPARYGRTLTLRIGSRAYHFCARCTGQGIGFLLVLTLFLASPAFGTVASAPFALVVFGLLPSPALADWLWQSARSHESNNPVRVASGALLGAAFGGLVGYGLSGRWWLFGGSFALLGLYLALATLVLYRSGTMERVVAEHFP